jgi:hypothetical protein
VVIFLPCCHGFTPRSSFYHLIADLLRSSNLPSASDFTATQFYRSLIFLPRSRVLPCRWFFRCSWFYCALGILRCTRDFAVHVMFYRGLVGFAARSFAACLQRTRGFRRPSATIGVRGRVLLIASNLGTPGRRTSNSSGISRICIFRCI